MTGVGISTAIADRYNDRSYLESNAEWHVKDSAWKAAQIVHLLNQQDLHPATVAEVGCGAGEILVNLSRALPNAQLDGYEMSHDAFAICKPKESDQLRFRLADVTEAGDSYDLLLCIDVIEHVDDYMSFLRRLKPIATWKVFHIPLDIHVNALFRGGFLRARDLVGHLHYFTTETALATLKDTGYEAISSFHTAAFDSTGQLELRGAVAVMRWPRRAFFALSPNMLSKTLGGCSLMVLAR